MALQVASLKEMVGLRDKQAVDLMEEVWKCFVSRHSAKLWSNGGRVF